jgi:hypothetical protein
VRLLLRKWQRQRKLMGLVVRTGRSRMRMLCLGCWSLRNGKGLHLHQGRMLLQLLPLSVMLRLLWMSCHPMVQGLGMRHRKRPGVLREMR